MMRVIGWVIPVMGSALLEIMEGGGWWMVGV